MKYLALLLIAISSLANSSFYADAQSLPDPMAPTAPNADTGTLTVGTVSIGATPSFAMPDASVARSMEERIVSKVDGLANLIQQNQSNLRQLGAKATALESEHNRLLAERTHVLEDYKSGYFCNQCGKARSEFRTVGDFWDHIAEGRSQGRKAVPASEEQTRQKEAEYDQRIRANDAEYTSTQLSMKKIEDQSRVAYDQIQQGFNLWRTAQSFEATAIKERQRQDQNQFESEITQATSEASKLQVNLNAALNSTRPDKATIDELRSGKKMWEDMATKSKEASELSATYYRDDLRKAGESEGSQYASLTSSIQKTSEYLSAMRSASEFLPTLNLSIQDVNVNMSPEQLGVRFSFGLTENAPVKGTIGLTATNSATSVESKAFIELFGQIAQVGWRTTNNPDGTLSNGPTFYMGSKPRPARGASPKPADKPFQVALPKLPANSSLPQP